MAFSSSSSSSSLITSPIPITPATSLSSAPLICNISPCRRLFNSITVRPKPISAVSIGSRITPWLMLPPSFEGGEMVYNMYNFTNKSLVYFNAPEEAEFGGDAEVVGSSHGFLALFHKRTHALFLYNPVSGTTIALPSIHTLSLTDIGLGPVDMRVTKVIISDDQSRAMIIYGPADRLAFCCPGRSTEWTPLGALFSRKKYYCRAYCDIVYSERDKVFICCTDCGDMEQWDLRLSRAGKQLNSVYQLEFEPNEKYQPAWWYDIMTKEEEEEEEERRLISIEDDAIEKETYVVFAEHSNQLYVVYRYIMERQKYVEEYSSRDGFPERDWDDSYPHKTIGFSVYKAGPVGVRMLQLNYMKEGSNLDNLVMFLGRNHSFALPSNDYPDLRPNSIYFTDNPCHTPIDWQTYGAHDTAIYDYNDRTFHTFDYRPANDVSSIKGIVPPPLWFTPSLH